MSGERSVALFLYGEKVTMRAETWVELYDDLDDGATAVRYRIEEFVLCPDCSGKGCATCATTGIDPLAGTEQA